MIMRLEKDGLKEINTLLLMVKSPYFLMALKLGQLLMKKSLSMNPMQVTMRKV